jgi:chemotaxis protein MotB
MAGGKDQAAAPIIVKRIKKGGHGGHHGGAWKIAYADFVTAMMAFFLLLWLLGSTSKGDLKGIAEMFRNPVKVSMAGGSGSGDATTVLQGGGTDLTRSAGQVSRSDPNTLARQPTPEEMAKALHEADMLKLNELKDKLESLINVSTTLQPYRDQIKFDITEEGLRIQIVDAQNRPMFDAGSAQMKDYSRVILRELALTLNDVGNKISISGHTDSTPFSGGLAGYSNWELSTDRANAARRELVAAGGDPSKVIRVVGLADSVPFTANDPAAPANRRISIVVLNKRSEEFLKKGGVSADTPPTAITPITLPSLPTNTSSAPVAR